jgi:hypothetical protein
MSAGFPFKKQFLPEGGFISRLRGKPPKEIALIELGNQLADGVETVSQDDVNAIEEKYGVNLSVSFPLERQDMYRSYVNFCFTKQPLAGRPPELRHLRYLLRLADSTAEPIERQVVEDVYRRAVGRRVADRMLNAGELEYLGELQRSLSLSQSVVDALKQDEVDKAIRAYLNLAIEDGMLSPDEVAEVHRTISDLGVKFRLTPEQQARWDRYRLYWQLQLGPLPPTVVTVNLQKNETCYFATASS